MRNWLFFALLWFPHGAMALDPACTTTANLGMARCPENSEDWYESYTDQIDELDALAKTAKSSFTILGDARAVGLLTASTATASSMTLTGVGGPFNLTSSTGVRINTGKLSFGSGGFVEWADGTKSTTASSGGSGAGGHTIASGTLSGSAVGTLAGTLSQRTTLYFDSAGFELYDDSTGNATLVKSKGYQVLASTASRWCSSIGVSVGNGLAVGITTVTLTTGNNSTMVCFSGTADTNNSGTSTRLGVMRDGAWMTGFSSTKGMTIAPDAENAAFCIKDTSVSAGQHSYVLMGSHDAGGTFTTSVPQAGSTNCAEFNVTELATGGNGYAAPASSHGAVATFTNATNAFVFVTGSSRTIQASGAPVEAMFSGSFYNSANSNGIQLGVGCRLNGGAFFWVGDTGSGASDGIVYVTQPGANFQVNGSFNYPFTPSSSGTLTCGLYVRGDANNTIISANAKNRFGIKEIRNAPGTGDVSSNGNNNFTGVNTFQRIRVEAQPFIDLSSVTATSIPNSLTTFTPMYWGAASTNTAYGFTIGTDSSTITTTIAGDVECSGQVTLNANTTTIVRTHLYENGIMKATFSYDGISNNFTSAPFSRKFRNVAAGTTFQVRVSHEGAGATTAHNRPDTSFFQCENIQ